MKPSFAYIDRCNCYHPDGKEENQPTHVLVDSNPAFEEPSMILLEQIFTIDKSRIERFMGYASKAEMLRIDMALLVSLALNVLSGNRSE